MNYERRAGMMWGLIAGWGAAMAIWVHPLMVLFVFVAAYFCYSFGRPVPK